MDASLAHPDLLPPRMAEDAGIEQWLEALEARECTAEEFLAMVLDAAQKNPDLIWEALALLDQHFRRRLIQPQVHAALKSSLHQHSLGQWQARGQPARAPARDEPLAAPRRDAEASAPEPLRVGDVLCGRYRVVDLLQGDATGTLVEAIDEHKAGMAGIRQRLAIQVVSQGDSRTAEMQRLGRLQALSHPGIPRIFDVEQDHGSLLLTMELLKGVPLRELLDRGGGQMATSSALGILRAVASALTYAHAHGVTHGGVGVHSVFITDLGEVRLRGFGLTGSSAGDPGTDRRCFASLVYALLGGVGDAGYEAHEPGVRLRRPVGITRARWRWVRSALEGDGDAAARLLAAFAEDAGAPLARVSTLQAFEQPAARRKGVREWVATSMLLLLVIAVGFVYMGSRAPAYQYVAQAGSAAPPAQREVAAAPAPVPQAEPALPVVAAPPAPAEASAPVAEVSAAIAPPVGPPRIDLPTDAAWVETTEPVARLWVRRRGSLAEAVTFRWWTESGSALPDRDFRTITPRTAVIGKGARGVEILVPLVPDATRGEARTFFVKIDAEQPGVSLGSRTLMQVAIVPPGYPAAR